MKNNRFIQYFLWEKQKCKHRKAYFHLIVFVTIVIFSEINKIGAKTTSIREPNRAYGSQDGLWRNMSDFDGSGTPLGAEPVHF